MVKKTHHISIGGVERELPIVRISDSLSIAVLIMLTDVELTIGCARELLMMTPDFDVIITAETKGIPLAYEMARQSNTDYVVARKTYKIYMQDPIEVTVQSITNETLQKLYLDAKDVAKLKGKHVLIVDDVISNGGSIEALEKLTTMSEGIIVGKATALAEGAACERDDIVYLGEIPLYFD